MASGQLVEAKLSGVVDNKLVVRFLMPNGAQTTLRCELGETFAEVRQRLWARKQEAFCGRRDASVFTIAHSEHRIIDSSPIACLVKLAPVFNGERRAAARSKLSVVEVCLRLHDRIGDMWQRGHKRPDPNLATTAEGLMLKRTNKGLWNDRFFVLQGTTLFWFHDEAELLRGEAATKILPLGACFARQATPAEFGKPNALVIEAQGVVGREFVLASDNFIEFSKWLRAINLAAMRRVKSVITTVGEEFLRRGFSTDGIFRKSAQKSVYERVKSQFDAGTFPDVTQVSDPDVLAGVFKAVLREMPDPVLTTGLYGDFVALGGSPPDTRTITAIRELVVQLPVENQALLQYLSAFIREAAKAEETTRMDLKNLVIVFAPNILRPPTENAAAAMSDSKAILRVCQTLVESYVEIWLTDDDAPARPTHRATTGHPPQCVPMQGKSGAPVLKNSSSVPSGEAPLAAGGRPPPMLSAALHAPGIAGSTSGRTGSAPVTLSASADQTSAKTLSAPAPTLPDPKLLIRELNLSRAPVEQSIHDLAIQLNESAKESARRWEQIEQALQMGSIEVPSALLSGLQTYLKHEARARQAALSARNSLNQFLLDQAGAIALENSQRRRIQSRSIQALEKQQQLASGMYQARPSTASTTERIVSGVGAIEEAPEAAPELKTTGSSNSESSTSSASSAVSTPSAVSPSGPTQPLPSEPSTAASVTTTAKRSPAPGLPRPSGMAFTGLPRPSTLVGGSATPNPNPTPISQPDSTASPLAALGPRPMPVSVATSALASTTSAAASAAVAGGTAAVSEAVARAQARAAAVLAARGAHTASASGATKATSSAAVSKGATSASDDGKSSSEAAEAHGTAPSNGASPAPAVDGLGFAVALYPFAGGVRKDGELTFSPSDQVHVLKDTGDGWLYGRLTDDSGRAGWFPASYVQYVVRS